MGQLHAAFVDDLTFVIEGTRLCPPVSQVKSDGHRGRRNSSMVSGFSLLLHVRPFASEHRCIRYGGYARPAHPIWIEATRYLNMDLLSQQQKGRRHLGTAA
jgi:hypothetical protein